MEKKAPLLTVTLRKLLLAFIWASSCSAQRYRLFDVPPETRFFVGSVPATDVAECLLAAKGFDGKLARGQSQPNVATWCSQNRRCNAYSLPGHSSSPLINFFLENQLTRNPTTCFQTILPIRQPRMVFFWPLTQHTKGRNFGTTWPAKEADFSTSGVCNFVAEGPYPWSRSDHRFCFVQWPKYPPLIPLVINRRRVFDFSKDFTIAMWIKNSDCGVSHHLFTVFTGMTLASPKPTSFLMFNCNQLYLEEQAQSTINDGNKYKWRHIVVVHQAAHGKVKFYRDAAQWPILQRHFQPRRRATLANYLYINFFNLPDGSMYLFKGNIAMVMVIQRAVPFNEISDLMRGNV